MSGCVTRHVEATKSALAEAVAARLREVIIDAVASRGAAHVVLTGGSMGSASLAGLADSEIPWQLVHLWWGDERYLPAGDGERNETQARAALLDHVDIPAANVHPMGARADGDTESSLTQHAARYAEDLARFADASLSDAPVDAPAAPVFDVVMLGVGPDTHVASLFPGQEATRIKTGTVAGVVMSLAPNCSPLAETVTSGKFAAVSRTVSPSVWANALGTKTGPPKAMSAAQASGCKTARRGACGKEMVVFIQKSEQAMACAARRHTTRRQACTPLRHAGTEIQEKWASSA